MRDRTKEEGMIFFQLELKVGLSSLGGGGGGGGGNRSKNEKEEVMSRSRSLEL